MKRDDSTYIIEHKGLLALDKFLIGYCVAVVPGVFQILASKPVFVGNSKMWGVWLIYTDIPALFCLLWHSFRWPLRLKIMEWACYDAVQKFGNDMIHYAETVMAPKFHESVGALPQIEGDDGKMYVRKADAKKTVTDVIDWGLSSKNPIVGNIITAHSGKIYEANRNAAVGLLDERLARLKQVTDLFCRYGRYWFFIGVVVYSVMFALSFLTVK